MTHVRVIQALCSHWMRIAKLALILRCVHIKLHVFIAGGDSKTLMFVQISPSEQDLSETLSSLNFATRVRGIELGPAKKQIDTSELQRMKLMVGLMI